MFRSAIFSLVFSCLTLSSLEASELTKTLIQFGQQLEQYHFSKDNSYHNELNHVEVTHVSGIGAIFTLQYRQPLQIWQANHPEKAKKNVNHSPKLNEQQINKQFNELRIKAKNLSHQAYSIERQIKSMKKSVDQLSGEQKSKRQEQIALLEKELELLDNEKSLLKPKYEHAQALSEQLKNTVNVEQTSSYEPSYIRDIQNFIVNKLCQSTTMEDILTTNDKLVFNFKQVGKEQRLAEDLTHFQDLNMTIDLTQMSQCISGERSIAEIKNTLKRSYF